MRCLDLAQSAYSLLHTAYLCAFYERTLEDLVNFVIPSQKYRNTRPGMQANRHGVRAMISIIRKKGAASVKDRISLGTAVFMVAVFFLYCLAFLFGIAPCEAVQNQEEPKAPLVEPETRERPRPVTVNPVPSLS